MPPEEGASVAGAEPIAEGRGSLYDEVISGLEDSMAKRAGITLRGFEGHYRRAAPRVQEQLQDETDLAVRAPSAEVCEHASSPHEI